LNKKEISKLISIDEKTVQKMSDIQNKTIKEVSKLYSAKKIKVNLSLLEYPLQQEMSLIMLKKNQTQKLHLKNA